MDGGFFTVKHHPFVDLFLLHHVENFVYTRQGIEGLYLATNCGERLVVQPHQKLMDFVVLRYLKNLFGRSAFAFRYRSVVAKFILEAHDLG